MAYQHTEARNNSGDNKGPIPHPLLDNQWATALASCFLYKMNTIYILKFLNKYQIQRWSMTFRLPTVAIIKCKFQCYTLEHIEKEQC